LIGEGSLATRRHQVGGRSAAAPHVPAIGEAAPSLALDPGAARDAAGERTDGIRLQRQAELAALAPQRVAEVSEVLVPGVGTIGHLLRAALAAVLGSVLVGRLPLLLLLLLLLLLRSAVAGLGRAFEVSRR